MAALQRLVNASIAALRNASSNQGKKSQRPPPLPQSYSNNSSDEHALSARSFASSSDASLHDSSMKPRHSVYDQQSSPDSERRSASTGRLNFYRPPGFPPAPSSPPAKHAGKGEQLHRSSLATEHRHKTDHVRFASGSEESYNRIRERYSHGNK